MEASVGLEPTDTWFAATPFVRFRIEAEVRGPSRSGLSGVTRTNARSPASRRGAIVHGGTHIVRAPEGTHGCEASESN